MSSPSASFWADAQPTNAFSFLTDRFFICTMEGPMSASRRCPVTNGALHVHLAWGHRGNVEVKEAMQRSCWRGRSSHWMTFRTEVCWTFLADEAQRGIGRRGSSFCRNACLCKAVLGCGQPSDGNAQPLRFLAELHKSQTDRMDRQDVLQTPGSRVHIVILCTMAA